MAAATDESSTIEISAIGLEGQELTVLKVAINLLAGHDITAILREDGDVDGDLLVIDGDSERGKQCLTQCKGKPALILASQEMSVDNPLARMEVKPIRVQAMSNVLHELSPKALEVAGSKTKQKQERPKAPEVSYGDLPPVSEQGATNLFELLLSAKHDKRRLKVEIPGLGDLLMCASEGVIAYEGDKKGVYSAAATPIAELNVSDIDKGAFEVLADEMIKANHGVVLWNMAIVGRYDKLPPGHSEKTVIKLRAWPNFTRLGVGSNHINISAILTRQPMSIEQVSSVAKLPLDTVAAFYNGAYAIGLLQAAKQSSAETAKPAVNENRRGLFAKIADRLSSMKSE